MNGDCWLADVIRRFRELKSQCDRALDQVPFERWGQRLDPEANSIVTLMLHLSGNMRSRWTDFLTSDGEKLDRDRDNDPDRERRHQDQHGNSHIEHPDPALVPRAGAHPFSASHFLRTSANRWVVCVCHRQCHGW